MNLKLYKLGKKLTKNKINNIYLFLNENIKGSVFTIFGLNYFLKLLQINYQYSFYITHKKKIVSYVAYINKKNEIIMKKKLFLIILKNFIIFFPILVINYKFFFKIHQPPQGYIQLIHLIIKLEKRNKKLKSHLHKKVEYLNKKVSYKKYKGIYAIYENKNIVASKYYKKNNYKIFKKNIFFTFVKKKI